MNNRSRLRNNLRVLSFRAKIDSNYLEALIRKVESIHGLDKALKISEDHVKKLDKEGIDITDSGRIKHTIGARRYYSSEFVISLDIKLKYFVKEGLIKGFDYVPMRKLISHGSLNGVDSVISRASFIISIYCSSMFTRVKGFERRLTNDEFDLFKKFVSSELRDVRKSVSISNLIGTFSREYLGLTS